MKPKSYLPADVKSELIKLGKEVLEPMQKGAEREMIKKLRSVHHRGCRVSTCLLIATALHLLLLTCEQCGFHSSAGGRGWTVLLL